MFSETFKVTLYPHMRESWITTGKAEIKKFYEGAKNNEKVMAERKFNREIE